jgi:energy-coupling factor transporter ATP-binding protein EcfA2
MHLADSKPITVQPAKRIKKGKDSGGVEEVVKQSQSYKYSPVTLVIGPVGAGKTTYLKHFELIKGKRLISKEKSHWVYIDSEEMGKEGNPRKFIYEKLNSYLLAEHPYNPTDYDTVIEPAYESEIKAIARGPYAKIFRDKEKFNDKINELIHRDYVEREPYVEKVF